MARHTPSGLRDGHSLGFFAGQKLKKVDVASGAVQTLCDAVNGRGASWGADGLIVFAPDYQSGLFSVSSSGGSPQPLTHPESGATHRMPFFLPDGRHLLFFATKPDGTPEGIFSVDVKSGTPVLVAAEANEGRYAATGDLLFLRGNNLMAQPFDVAGQRTTGSATVIVENISASPDRYTGHTPSRTTERSCINKRQAFWPVS